MNMLTRSLHRRSALGALFALGAAAAAGPALAADPFPAKPITLVMPFPPGGSFDPIFRPLADAASRELGQPIVLMHRPGAGGINGPGSVAVMNESDGYTLAVIHNSVIRAPLLHKINWHPLRDFTYLAGLFGMVTGIVVAHDAPWKTLDELLADAKKRPGAISWGTVGATSINRIYGERLARMNGTTFNMVPFKGGGEAFTAVVGRHLDVYGDPGFGAQVQGGKVRLLATFTAERLPRYPGVPTVKELGYDLVIDSPVGLAAPKNLDPKIAARLAAAFRKAAADPVYQSQLEQFDMQPKWIDGEAYAAYAKAQFERDTKMLTELGFKPE
ncbi:tripartite tricarboxylate transporter substrate binding protein [Variovorax sp. LjRoot290]|uniref:tripartite tricarboxylate transporter substrate binding protein n=1 Tax=unclassified Variovorax TaxID=663243 RepID=UPI0008887864|nr:tripartite tricarboxylate transporter substrate binding protein [Variovorax sp. CF079]SDE89948.1 Tripartite-type tricarboxylate transporter, receptor component TctC [Variovorax sp. CF079]